MACDKPSKECLKPAFDAVAGSDAVNALLNVITATWYVSILFLGLLIILAMMVGLSTGKPNALTYFTQFLRFAALVTFVGLIIGT
ncbi:hypothetical protein A1QO_00585 [Vibrio genomosp. F10 str. ZF-129]|uniref:Uncharacterized protein n=1 Tax=Vibrio genomosp. F10 str. ZF-129 TaxID=1187848 RepID=A0A1E5BGA2_9VIBR|nr:hypothetical protein [Vibrio genomosp. F10]OEE35288.1 hypothetical protein A1QO_00585 [Vibrio genomosp. F10 str. ZF-129]